MRSALIASSPTSCLTIPTARGGSTESGKSRQSASIFPSRLPIVHRSPKSWTSRTHIVCSWPTSSSKKRPNWVLPVLLGPTSTKKCLSGLRRMVRATSWSSCSRTSGFPPEICDTKSSKIRPEQRGTSLNLTFIAEKKLSRGSWGRNRPLAISKAPSKKLILPAAGVTSPVRHSTLGSPRSPFRSCSYSLFVRQYPWLCDSMSARISRSASRSDSFLQQGG